MTRLAWIALLLGVPVVVHAQGFGAQFDHLMGDPKETVSALVLYPWKSEVQITLPGLSDAPHGDSIRMVSIERPVAGYTRWSHWNNADGTAWVDVVDFPSRFTAIDLLASASQLHSGYRWEDQLLLFTNLCDAGKDAVGAALIGPSGRLLNVGMTLNMAVCPDRATDSDRRHLDAMISQLESVLRTLANGLLDPAYVTFDPKIAPKAEMVRMLRVAGFSRLWSEVKYNFVYLDKRPGVDWDGVLERYLPRIAAAQDDIEYGRILQEAVALLKDGHTNVYPRASAPLDAPLLTLEPIQGKPVVTAVGNLPELAALKPGMELIEVDHTTVQTIIERDLDPYISSSTAQDRALREMRMILQGPPDSSMETKWLDPRGHAIQLTLRRNGSKSRAALPKPRHEAFEYKELAGNISYMALNDFGSDSVAAEFESKLDQARNAKAWILDLRENGGGNGSVGYRILSHLLISPAQTEAWRTRLYNPTFQAWRKPQEWYEGAPDTIEMASGSRYSGPVYVLTSPATCSAAEDFLIPLKMQKRAILVGEPTCGSSGQPLSFSIYGADVRVCTKWDRFPDGTEFVGVGIVPDLKVFRTKKDVSAGRDAALEAAIHLASP
jgi:carboxyl-terminal processing protease